MFSPRSTSTVPESLGWLAERLACDPDTASQQEPPVSLANQGHLIRCCLGRLRRWRVPPNWCYADWFEELGAIASAAAWTAFVEFDASRGVPLGLFLRSRILAAAYTRYRQEWSYARHCGDGFDPSALHELARDGAQESLDSVVAAHELVEQLPPRDAELLNLIFWQGCTQEQAGQHLHLSQRAISKRLASICNSCRTKSSTSGEACFLSRGGS